MNQEYLICQQISPLKGYYCRHLVLYNETGISYGYNSTVQCIHLQNKKKRKNIQYIAYPKTNGLQFNEAACYCISNIELETSSNYRFAVSQ